MGDTISDRLGNSALAADAKLESAKIAGQERMAESKEKLELARESSQKRLEESKEKLETAVESSQRKFAESKERFAESREKLGDRITESLQELQQKKQRLEARQKELSASLGEGARFGTRRLTGAFPGLRERSAGVWRKAKRIRMRNGEKRMVWSCSDENPGSSHNCNNFLAFSQNLHGKQHGFDISVQFV